MMEGRRVGKNHTVLTLFHYGESMLWERLVIVEKRVVGALGE